MSTSPARLPVAYIPHGGGPWPFVELGFSARESGALRAYLEALAGLTGGRPRAVLAVSAHWEQPVPTVQSAAHPPLLFDYSGFPAEAYTLTWPAPGDPGLAARVRALLAQAGLESAEDGRRGFDHGTFVPLKLTYPAADVPTVQISLIRGLDPAAHLALGRALQPLRDEGVFIVGSGMSFHNLRLFRDARAAAPSAAFDAWVQGLAGLPASERDRRLLDWEAAPQARMAHPREEHLLPLHVVAGAAGDDVATVGFSGVFSGWALTGLHFGAASSRAV